MKNLYYKNNRLFFENIDLDNLSNELPTPFYLYSQKSIKENINEYLSSANSRTLFCYSVKANSNMTILNLIASEGLGFDVVSQGELYRALKTGVSTKKIVYSGVGKTRDEIKYALENNILCFNVESKDELMAIDQEASSMGLIADISIRVNPNVKVETHPYISTGMKDNKFGIQYEHVIDIYKQARTLESINIIGIDFHIGSQIMSTSPYLESISSVKRILEELNDCEIKITHIDVGGGLGISYKDESQIDRSNYVAKILDSFKDNDVDIIFEPGRSIIGDCGILVSTVQYTKESDHKNFLIVDASMSELMRPALYDAYHKITPIIKTDASCKKYDVVGPVCESADFLGKERELNCKVGDKVVVEDTGAYGFVLASNYNSRPRPAEYLISDGKVKLIRSVETLEQIVQNENC